MTKKRNSFTESLANRFTPNDGYTYVEGTLRKDTDKEKGAGKVYKGGAFPTTYGYLGQADSGNTGGYYQNTNTRGKVVDESRDYVSPIAPPKDAKNPRGSLGSNPFVRGLLGTLAPPVGIAMAAEAANRRSMDAARAANENLSREANPFSVARNKSGYYMPKGIKAEGIGEYGIYTRGGKYGDQKFRSSSFGTHLPVDDKGNIDLTNDYYPENNAMTGMFNDAAYTGDGTGIDERRSASPSSTKNTMGTQATGIATLAGNGMPAPSAMSAAAAAGEFRPIPDPNYDPNDPTSLPYLVNPSYDKLLAYNKSVNGMAEGGEVESALGGNEKSLINDAEKAIRGELDETRTAIILAQYVQQYGEDALMRLVESVESGEADETRAQFASGKNGMVRGNGDGSGVDDMVTAQLKDGDATQDVLLADGEFVLRKDAADSLQKAYGGGMLDKINDAGPDAAKALKKYLSA